MVWSADGCRILWANAAGAAVLGARTLLQLREWAFAADAPSAGQIAALAAGDDVLQDPVPLHFVLGLRTVTFLAAAFRLDIGSGEHAVLLAGTEPAPEAGPADRRALADAYCRIALDGGPAVLLVDGDRAVIGTAGDADAIADILAVLADIGLPETADAEARPPAEFVDTQTGRRAIETLPVAGAEGPLFLISIGAAEAGGEMAAEKSYPAFLFAPRMRPDRFLWEMDEDMRFRSISGDLERAVGPEFAALRGRRWDEVAEHFGLDRDGLVLSALQSRDTSSGLTVDWPVQDTDLRIPVDLAVMPIFGRDRGFRGYRGFGVCRTSAAFTDEARAANRPVDRAEPDPFEELAAAPAGAVEVFDLAADGAAEWIAVDGDEGGAIEAPESSSEDSAAAEAETAPIDLPAPAEDHFAAPGPDQEHDHESAGEADEPPAAEGAEEAVRPEEPDTERQQPGIGGRNLSERSAIGALAGITALFKAGAIKAETDANETPKADKFDEPATEATDAQAAAPAEPEAPADTEEAPATEPAPAAGNGKIVRLHAVKPEPEATDETLAPHERSAFREIARALGARLEGDDAAEPRQPKPARRGGASEAAATAPAMPVETALLDRLPGGVVICRGDRVLYANRALLALLGHDDIAGLAEAGGLDTLFHDGDNWKAESSRRYTPIAARHRDGDSIPVNARLVTVPFAGETAVMLLITEPSAAEHRIVELESIIASASDAALIVDAEATILDANPAAGELFGRSDDDLVGASLYDLLDAESRRSVEDYVESVMSAGVVSVLNEGREVGGRHADGDRLSLILTLGRIGARGDRLCAVFRDIGPWKSIELEMDEARRRAEAASAQKSDFLAKISHEVRTPLNAIIGFSEVIMDERFGPIGNERYRDYVRDIHTSGTHLISLINDLLDLSKIEAGKLELSFSSVDLGHIVEHCAATMQPEANRERVIIRTSVPAGVPPVVGDERSLRQIVLNLMSNAVKFTMPGGQVIVSTALEDDGEVTLRVRDTGVGMSAKEIETALEPFRQLATTSRLALGGTGLGLPLTKALAEANRAGFSIESALNQGTVVKITFPSTRVLSE